MKRLAPRDLRQPDRSDVKQRSGVQPPKLLGGLAVPGACLLWQLVSVAGTHGRQGMGTLQGGGAGLHRCVLPSLSPQGEALLGGAEAEKRVEKPCLFSSSLWSTRRT